MSQSHQMILFLGVAVLTASKIIPDLLPLYPRWSPFEWLLEVFAAMVSFVVASVAILPFWLLSS